MANKVNTHFKYLMLQSYLNGKDIRVMLLMSNTTVDTEEDVDNVAAYTTLDEMDGANYARKALANEAFSEDEANDRGEFDADNITWSSLGAGTREVKGMLVYEYNAGGDANCIPIEWVDTGGFPFNPGGGNVPCNWNAEGILQAT